MLGLSIAVSALLDLSDHGVDVVGTIPDALPSRRGRTSALDDAVALLPAAFGVLILSTEAVGVARSLATAHHYSVDPNRDLSAMGASNVLAGFRPVSSSPAARARPRPPTAPAGARSSRPR